MAIYWHDPKNLAQLGPRANLHWIGDGFDDNICEAH